MILSIYKVGEYSMKNQKTRIAIISVVALLLVLIGVTYAYWVLTKMQTNSNLVSSACLDITLDNESAAINLGSQYPMSDEDGMKLTPYTFTVTNNCNTSVDYQVALESIGEEATAIKASALKVALDNNVRLLSVGGTQVTTINGAYESNLLGYGTLAASGSEGSSATHSLRIWIDEDAPISEANKTFQSKISVTIGQEITNPYKEGTMAYDILANNDEPTTLNATFLSKEPAAETYNSVSKTANNWYGTSYTFDSETGYYQLSGDLVQATLEECRNGTKACGEYTLDNTTQDYKYKTLYKITSFTNTTKADTSSTLYMTTQSIFSTSIFNIPTADGEGKLYKTADDLGDSYYFRGDVTNNYVQFGAYATGSTVNGTTYNSETSMYWRIVRINGDGTIRLAYDGTAKVENGTTHNTIIGKASYNAEDYLNVNYGASDIKGVVDAWYNTHLKTNYGSYITDGIFCNEKEVTSEDTRYKYYSASARLSSTSNIRPQLTCTRSEDRYTTNSSLGNGQLTHPVGLLTADEAVFAGGSYYSNVNYYLVSGDEFWTSTPDHSSTRDYYTLFWSMYDDGRIGSGKSYSNTNFGVRPVVNLRADVEFTGNGSFETPYVIVTE